MGADQIELAMPAFERMWDLGYERLREGGLFARDPLLATRRFPAIPVGTHCLVAGRDYFGQLIGTDLHVVEAGSVVAKVPLPLEEQNRVRIEGRGAALVHVEESARPISGVADVNIR